MHYFPVTLFTHTNAAMASGAGLRPVSLERNYVEEGYLLEVPAKQRRTALGKDYPVRVCSVFHDKIVISRLFDTRVCVYYCRSYYKAEPMGFIEW